MYPWIVWLHVISIFGFLIAHGVSAGVFFALRRERDVDHIRTLLQLSSSSVKIMYVSLLVLLASGVIAGFMGRWWAQAWIWISLVLFLALFGVMAGLGSRVLNDVRLGLGLPTTWNQPARAELASPEELDGMLQRARPTLLATLGFGGFVLIAFLMMFKPF